MKLDRNVAFPFAEFDPLLRRNLNAVLEAARRHLEQSEGGRSTIRYRFQLRDRLAQFLRDSARQGERDPLRLFDNAVRYCGSGPDSKAA